MNKFMYTVESTPGVPIAVFSEESLAKAYLSALRRPEDWVVRPIELDPKPSED